MLPRPAPPTGVLRDLDVCAVQGADDERAVERKLHVAGAAGLRARGGDVLAASMGGGQGRQAIRQAGQGMRQQVSNGCCAGRHSRVALFLALQACPFGRGPTPAPPQQMLHVQAKKHKP